MAKAVNREELEKDMKTLFELLKRMKEDFKKTPEGMELFYLKDMLMPTIEKDVPQKTGRQSFIFATLVPKLQEYKKVFQERFGNSIILDEIEKLALAYEKKGKLFASNDPEYFAKDLEYYLRIYKLLQNNVFFSEDVKNFIKIVQELRQHADAHPGDKKIAAELKKTNSLTHLAHYHEELKLWEDWLAKISADKTWNFFLQEFYPKREQYIKLLRERFGSEDYAAMMENFFKDHNEDYNGTVQMMTGIVNKLRDPNTLKEEEKQAVGHLKQLVAERLKELVKDALDFKKELLKICSARAKKITGRHNKKLHRLEEIIDKISDMAVVGMGQNAENKELNESYYKLFDRNLEIKKWISERLAAKTFFSKADMDHIDQFVKEMEHNEKQMQEILQELIELAKVHETVEKDASHMIQQGRKEFKKDLRVEKTG